MPEFFMLTPPVQAAAHLREDLLRDGPGGRVRWRKNRESIPRQHAVWDHSAAGLRRVICGLFRGAPPTALIQRRGLNFECCEP